MYVYIIFLFLFTFIYKIQESVIMPMNNFWLFTDRQCDLIYFICEHAHQSGLMFWSGQKNILWLYLYPHLNEMYVRKDVNI